MAYCSNCGEKNKDGNRFCSNCGEPMGSIARSGPSKPIKSRQPQNDYYNNSYVERPSSRKNYQETQEISFEWNVVIVGALILVIVSGLLGWILPFFSVLIAAAIAIIYAISATQKKATILIIIPLILVMAASLFALFSL